MDGDGWSRIARRANELIATLVEARASGTVTILARLEQGSVRYGEVAFTERIQTEGGRAERKMKEIATAATETCRQTQCSIVSVTGTRKDETS